MGHGLVEGSFALLLGLLSMLAATVPQETSPCWVVVERRLYQVETDWKIAYRLRYTGRVPLNVSSAANRFTYEAVVSNTRCPAHGFPRSVALVLEGSKALAGHVDMISGEDRESWCRENVSVHVSAPPDSSRSVESKTHLVQASWTDRQPDRAEVADGRSLPSRQIELQPGDFLSVVVVLEHQHPGCRDPLLGTRHVKMHLGPTAFEDEVVLDRPHEPAALSPTVLAPDDGRCDHSTFHSPSSSLRLGNDHPRHRSYTFPSVPVSHASTVSVSFWYCAPRTSQGACRVRVVEYQDHAQGWTRLGGGFDETLPTDDQWTRFERRLTVLPTTNTLTFDFRVSGSDRAEAWIDDVKILPIMPVEIGR